MKAYLIVTFIILFWLTLVVYIVDVGIKKEEQRERMMRGKAQEIKKNATDR